MAFVSPAALRRLFLQAIPHHICSFIASLVRGVYLYKLNTKEDVLNVSAETTDLNVYNFSRSNSKQIAHTS